MVKTSGIVMNLEHPSFPTLFIFWFNSSFGFGSDFLRFGIDLLTKNTNDAKGKAF